MGPEEAKFNRRLTLQHQNCEGQVYSTQPGLVASLNGNQLKRAKSLHGNTPMVSQRQLTDMRLSTRLQGQSSGRRRNKREETAHLVQLEVTCEAIVSALLAFENQLQCASTRKPG